MGTYDITAPDGTKFRITGDSAQGAYAALQKHISSSQKPEDTGGFRSDVAKGTTDAIPMPGAGSSTRGMDAPGVDQPPAFSEPDSLTAAMMPDSIPFADRATPPSPPPTPRAQDPMPTGMMGGASDDQVMWARREIARQMAETGEVPVPQGDAALIEAMTRTQKDDVATSSGPVPSTPDYTPTGQAILSELGNVPERIQRGFAGNRLAMAEKGLLASAEDIGKAKSDAADPQAALDAVREKKAAVGLQFSKSTDVNERMALEAEIRALGEEERRLVPLVAVPGMAESAIETNRDQFTYNQRNRAEAQAEIDSLEAKMTPVNAKPGLSRAVVSGIASIGDMAPGLVTTLAARNPLPMLVYLGAYSRGSTYVDKRAEGYDPAKAETAANLYAAAEAIPELIPLGVILKEGGGALYKISGGAITESASEVMTQGIQQLVDIGVLDESMTWEQAAAELAESGMAGGVMGGLMGGGAALSDRIGEGSASREAKKRTPADPNAYPPIGNSSQPYRPVTPHQPNPDPVPEDPLVAAMSPDAPVSQEAPAPLAQPVDVRETHVGEQQAGLSPTDAPQDAPQPASAEKDTSKPVEKIDTPDSEQDQGEFEVMDEVETVDGQTQPTGRRVRVNLKTGEAEVVPDEIGGSAEATDKPGLGGEVGPQPQASVDDVSSVSASPAAEPAATQATEAPTDPEGRKAPQRVFLSHDQTLSIKTDPQTFQYKGGTDTEGVSDRLRGATRFDPNRAGQAVLFERSDGTLIVADGHQRTGLARRSAEAGQEDVGGMAAVIYREADGYTPEEVMVEAALKNIGEDSGTATDAARILRARKETISELGLPPNSAKVRTADGLRRLSDQAFGMVANGVASERDGAAVGKHVADPALQTDVLALLTKLKPENEAQAAMIARDAASAATTETQDSLFGPEQVQQSLFLERARVLDGAMRVLGKNIATFRTLVDRAEAITNAGNRLAKKENASQLDDSTKVRQYLASQANMKGPISDALTNAASELKSGRPIGQAIEGFVRNARTALASGGAKSEGSARGGKPAAAAVEEKPVEAPKTAEPVTPDESLFSAMMPEPPKPAKAEAAAPVTKPATEAPARTKDLFDQKDARGPGERQMDIEDLIDEKKSEAKQAEAGGNDGTEESGSEDAAAGDRTPADKGAESQANDTGKAGDQASGASSGKDVAGRLTDKIDDFGAKITGAAKDRWTEYAKRLDDIPDADVVAEPLSKSFPEPNYQGLLDDGVDPWSVAFIRAARDLIPTKPQKSWKLKDWTYQVIALRKFSRGILSGEIKREDLTEALTAPQYARLKRDIEGSIDLYLAVGHQHSLKGMKLSSARYSVYQGKPHNPPIEFWEVTSPAKSNAFSNMPRVLVSAKTRVEAINQFQSAFEKLVGQAKAKAKASGTTRFDIYRRRNSEEKRWIIGKKVGSDYIDLQFFGDIKEARAYLAEHGADLEAQLEKMKDIPNERRDTNSPRVGIDHRMGADVTPQMFSEAFGFRGVQFGNYVENAKRQSDLNEAYDAFMDLAGVIGVSPKALSLNGQLALAFGARGRGGKRPAKAHYEPGQIVINLTKNFGAGSLAHEWFHAVDNYFERERGRPVSYVTDYPRSRAEGLTDREIRGEVLKAFLDLRKAIDRTALSKRSSILDRTRSTPYWSTGIEMHARSFESYVIGKLQDQGASNDYLANIVDEAVFNAEAALSGSGEGGYPYPIASEVPEIRAAFDNLFKIIETRETPNGIAFYQRELPNSFDDGAPIDDSFAPLSREIVRRYMPRLRAELDRLDLKRVKLYHDATGAEWQGMFLQYGPNDMEVIVGASMDPMKTIHHEVIHILRAMNLFTPAEWQALEAQAVKKWMAEFDIEARYPTLTLPEQMEEAIAEAFSEAAALRRRPDGPIIGQAFRKIARLLRAILDVFTGAGFQTAEDIFGKVYDGKLTKRAKDEPGMSGDLAFAQKNHQKPANEFEKADLTPSAPMLSNDQIAKIKADLASSGRADPDYKLSETPPVMRALGIEKPMIVRKSIFEKARDKHGLTEDETIKAIQELYSPVMVFESDTLKDTFTALVETGSNKTMVVAIHPDAQTGRMAVSMVASVYAKKNAGIIREWMNKGLTRYLNKRSAEAWFQSRRLQLPREGTAHRRKLKILQHRDVFKGQGGAPKLQAARLPSRQARAHMATAMQGAVHIPDRRVWEELHRAGAPIWDRMREGVGALNDAIDRLRIKLQDRFLPVMRAQQAVERTTGAPLPEQYDAYLVETTFSGKAGRHLFDIDEKFTKPIIAAVAETNGDLTVDQVSEYLTALHAEERNDRIAKINPKMPDGGSGMTTPDAKAILNAVAAGPHAARLAKISALIDEMREWGLKLRVDAGLMTKAEADLWRTQYRHYVPLKGFAETENTEAFLDMNGIGRRFNVRGEESRRALGRRSQSFNVLQTAITQAQEVAIRAEKARVGAALYRLAKDYPSKAMWEVKPVETARYFNKTTGLVETRAVNPLSMILQPNELAVKIDGAEHRIIFHDPRLANSAASVGADQMGWFVQVMSVIGRWFSMTRTMLNPEFVISNAFRDMTAAQVNIQDFGEADRNAIAKAMIKNWPKAFAGVYRGSGHRFDTVWAKHYDEFTKAGAKVEFWTLEQPEAGLKDLDRRIWLKSGSRARRLLKGTVSPSAFFSTRDNGVLHFIERTNMAVDNAIRLAAFVEARKKGWSEAQAAALSKNLTVNFNRRGEASPTINALYTFFNAAVQGSATTAKAIIRSRRVRYIVLAMIAAGFLNDMSNAYLSHEDDDGVLAYDKIPDFQSQRAIQFMLGKDAENAASIPMPYGYNIFPYLGQQIGKVNRGVKSPEEAMKDVAVALFGAFSPVQGGDAYAFFAPTVVDPVLEMARNVDWLGRPIMPDYDHDKRPDSQKFYGSASQLSQAVAEAANAMTGGTTGSSGWIDVSPEYIDHTASFIFGSMGDFAGRSVDLVAKAAAGEFDELTTNDIPMLRVVVKDTYPGLDRDRYFRFRDLIDRASFAVKTAKETGEEVPEVMRKWASLATTLKAAEKRRKNGEDIYLRFNRKVTETFGAIGE